jgi:hypothetical protein
VIEIKGDAHGADIEAAVSMEDFDCLETDSGGVCYLVTYNIRRIAS